MPIYEYECCECRCRFEKKQRFYDEAVATCPKCQGKSRRVLSSVSIVFKGSGFYVTDYRKEKPEKGEEKPSETKGKQNSEGATTKSNQSLGDRRR